MEISTDAKVLYESECNETEKSRETTKEYGAISNFISAFISVKFELIELPWHMPWEYCHGITSIYSFGNGESAAQCIKWKCSCR